MKRKANKITVGLFIVYMIILTWIILFKFSFNFERLDHYRNINLNPFGGSMIVNDRIDITEIIYNVIVFIPMGIFTCLLKPNWSFIQKMAPAFLASLVFEAMQFILAIGASDITDLLGNTFGGIIGIVIFFILRKIAKDKTEKVINIVGILLLGIFLALVILLFINNI